MATDTKPAYTSLGGIRPHPMWPIMSYLTSYLPGVAGPTGFGSKSTAEQVAAGWDGKGKVVAITGASAGLGAESARVLAERGATLILLIRNEELTAKLVSSIKEKAPNADIRVIKCNLESLPSVVCAAKQVLATKLPLHTLMLNAGVMAPPFTLTEQGLELQIGVNHVAHVLLARYLLPLMVESAKQPGAPQGRIIALSSTGHHLAPRYGMRARERINSPEGFKTWVAYGQSKLANLLFARELAVRLDQAGVKNVTAVSCHPGVIPGTELARHMKVPGQNLLIGALTPFLKTIPTGAATQVYLATAAGKLKGGEYWSDCNIAASSKLAHDAALGAKLWSWTEEQIAAYVDKEADKQQPLKWDA